MTIGLVEQANLWDDPSASPHEQELWLETVSDVEEAEEEEPEERSFKESSQTRRFMAIDAQLDLVACLILGVLKGKRGT